MDCGKFRQASEQGPECKCKLFRATGGVERSHLAPRCLRLEICTQLEHYFYGFSVTRLHPPDCSVHRSVAIIVPIVDAHPTLPYQQPRNVCVAVKPGNMYGSVSVLVTDVDIGARVEEHLDRVKLSRECGYNKRSASFIVLHANDIILSVGSPSLQAAPAKCNSMDGKIPPAVHKIQSVCLEVSNHTRREQREEESGTLSPNLPFPFRERPRSAANENLAFEPTNLAGGRHSQLN